MRASHSAATRTSIAAMGNSEEPGAAADPIAAVAARMAANVWAGDPFGDAERETGLS